ncbi:tetratricopeptide repeat protein [Ferroplasma sp. Type II]|uniref:tetratricopeptide repeat protein n=1 Tax=Ferroplasma sp. Type II TaxID=261388 RepID=UPI0025C34DFB|nr:tetratricopeptide repeat protein [Ferroplasma sp. Type II]
MMGRFSDARVLFHDISSKYKNGSGNELYLKSQIQIGDLTFLSGRFRDSMKILESASGETNMDSGIYAELLRIEGHIYRFNFMLEEAIGKYFNSLELARTLNILGLQGKIYNNLAESYCWIQPEKAIEYGNKSLEINKNLNAPVEYGKTYAAMSIACSMNGDFSSSLKYSDMALSTQEGIKYPGGMLYAHGSYCLLYLMSGNHDKFMMHYSEMKNLVHRLNAVEFTMIPYYIYLNSPELKYIVENMQWIDFTKTLNNVKAIFGS